MAYVLGTEDYFRRRRQRGNAGGGAAAAAVAAAKAAKFRSWLQTKGALRLFAEVAC